MRRTKTDTAKTVITKTKLRANLNKGANGNCFLSLNLGRQLRESGVTSATHMCADIQIGGSPCSSTFSLEKFSSLLSSLKVQRIARNGC